MGTYKIPSDEIEEKLEDFIRSFDGEIHADELAKAWNSVAKRFKWKDKLKSI